MQESQITFQIIGQNAHAFPANSFLVLKNGEEIICYLIFDDLSEDDTPCITISITPDTLKNFLKNSQLIVESIKNKTPTISPWDKKRKLMNQLTPFRPTVIMLTKYNDIVHFSFGYLHPTSINQYAEAKKNSSEPIVLQVPSLAEISMLDTHFLSLFETLSKL